MPFLSSPFDFIPFTFESLGLLNTIFMKSLKTGQYKRAQPLQKQFIKNVFLVVGFFNIRTIVKPRGGKMTLRIMEAKSNGGSISALIIRSDIEEREEDSDRYKINIVLLKSRKGRKEQEYDLIPKFGLCHQDSEAVFEGAHF